MDSDSFNLERIPAEYQEEFFKVLLDNLENWLDVFGPEYEKVYKFRSEQKRAGLP